MCSTGRSFTCPILSHLAPFLGGSLRSFDREAAYAGNGSKKELGRRKGGEKKGMVKRVDVSGAGHVNITAPRMAPVLSRSGLSLAPV